MFRIHNPSWRRHCWTQAEQFHLNAKWDIIKSVQEINQTTNIIAVKWIRVVLNDFVCIAGFCVGIRNMVKDTQNNISLKIPVKFVK